VAAVPRARNRRRLTEQETRDLKVRQANLTALSQHHSWGALVAEVVRREAFIERQIARSILRGKGLTLEQQAELRGYVAGLRWFTAAPEHAEQALERYLQSHGVTTTEESDAA
jgi:hypothetical protein